MFSMRVRRGEESPFDPIVDSHKIKRYSIDYGVLFRSDRVSFPITNECTDHTRHE